MPLTVCDTCSIERAFDQYSDATKTTTAIAPRIIDARTAFIMNSMLEDVVNLGTATKAQALGRHDLAGKTGTTNDQKDTWFSGFNRDLVTTVWVGFDAPASLGNNEYGATTALPIWMNFMSQALHDKPENTMLQPDGLVTVRIDPVTGLRVSSDNLNGLFEIFRAEDVPAELPPATSPNGPEVNQPIKSASPAELF